MSQKQMKLSSEQASKSSIVASMAEFKDSILDDELNEQMGTIHEAYLECKEELLNAGLLTSKSTYINTDFKDLVW